MTCRIARSFQRHLCIDLAMCCACGSANLEVCSTSRILGPHLCASCTRSRVECWVDADTKRSPERAAQTTSAEISLYHELQTST